MTGDRRYEVLLVEDNPMDVRLVRDSLRMQGVRCNLTVAMDGVEAMATLKHEGSHVSDPRPDLILLDLNLPKKDGREVLAELKADAALARIPVVVLSTSSAQDDIARAYALSANCFVSKPVDLDEFHDAMRIVSDFWLALARLPGKEA